MIAVDVKNNDMLRRMDMIVVVTATRLQFALASAILPAPSE